MKKRVIFVFRTLGIGGAQKIEAFVANALIKAGYDVVALNMASAPCTVDLDKRIRIVDVLYDSVESQSNQVIRGINKLQYLRKLRKAILEQKPNIVCVFLSDVVRITVLALKGTRIPIIGSERGDPNAFSKKQFLAYKKAYSHCSHVVFQLENVMNMYDLPASVKQKVIPNPCIPRDGKDKCVGTGEKKQIIFSAGRLAEQKRFDVLIDAFELVHQNHPEYCLHIYGNGPLKTELQTKIDNCEARDNISLMGDVQDVFSEASNAEFFVLSSDFEGVPNVILEAMHAGIPCIATDCSPGGARFLLGDGEYGLIVPKGDKDKLAEAMETYIENVSLRDMYAIKSKMVIANYEPQRIEKMWQELFREVKR